MTVIKGCGIGCSPLFFSGFLIGQVRDQLCRGLAGGRVMKAWIFGFCAKATATSETDVDVLIEAVFGSRLQEWGTGFPTSIGEATQNALPGIVSSG